MNDKNKVIEKVISQMRTDFFNEDETAVFELLSNLSISDLLSYLPEENV